MNENPKRIITKKIKVTCRPADSDRQDEHEAWTALAVAATNKVFEEIVIEGSISSEGAVSIGSCITMIFSELGELLEDELGEIPQSYRFTAKMVLHGYDGETFESHLSLVVKQK